MIKFFKVLIAGVSHRILLGFEEDYSIFQMPLFLYVP